MWRKHLSKKHYDLCERYLLLTLANKTIDHDLQVIRNKGIFRINEPYIQLLEKLKNQITEEWNTINLRVKTHNLCVVKQSDYEKKYHHFAFYKDDKFDLHRYFGDRLKDDVKKVIDEFLYGKRK